MRRLHRAAFMPLLTVALLICSSLALDLARAQAVRAAEEIYTDPSGRFTVPIPAGWSATDAQGFVVLADPENDITVSIVVVEAPDARAGIAAAWSIVDPSFDPAHQPEAVEQDVPAPPGTDELVVITYDQGATSGHGLQVVGQKVGSSVFVLILEGSIDAVSRRGSQLNLILTGFTVTGQSDVDLSGAAASPFRGELVGQFEAYVAELMQRAGIPGAAIAVVQDGQVVYSNGFGVRELGGNEPVTPDTLMMIGSTTKSMTTMMMASEVDDGLMRWDQPVISILPTFALADPELTKTTTMRNLVCACSGVPRRDAEIVFNANELSAEDVIASLGTFQISTPFGETFQYSNQMVATGGYAAAAVASGTTGELEAAYAGGLQGRVFEPIGMTRSTLDFAAVADDGNHASPHGQRLDGQYVPLSVEVEVAVLPVAPVGAVWSTAGDMARYLQTELAGGIAPGGRRAVSTANLAETWQPQVTIDATTSYGLGWFIGDYSGQQMIYHGGNSFGFTSDLAFLPDAGVGIVILTNARGAGSNVFTEAVRYKLFDLLFDQPGTSNELIEFAFDQAEQSIPAAGKLAEQADPAAVTPFLGQYHNEALGDIVLSLVGDHLIMDAGEFQTELRPLVQPNTGEPGYLAFDPPLPGLQVDLQQSGPDSTPQIVIWSGGDAYTFSLISSATPVEGG